MLLVKYVELSKKNGWGVIDRDTWRSGVRSAMRAASSCLEGGPLLSKIR